MTGVSMADVLHGHQDWSYAGNLGYYRTQYLCQCGQTFWYGEHEEDPDFNQALAAHQATVLAAAGFGHIATAIDDAAEQEDS